MRNHCTRLCVKIGGLSIAQSDAEPDPSELYTDIYAEA